MNGAAKAGLIHKKGYAQVTNPRAHCAPCGVWEAAADWLSAQMLADKIEQENQDTETVATTPFDQRPGGTPANPDEDQEDNGHPDQMGLF